MCARRPGSRARAGVRFSIPACPALQAVDGPVGERQTDGMSNMPGTTAASRDGSVGLANFDSKWLAHEDGMHGARHNQPAIRVGGLAALHDLWHTYGQRLREAGVPEEDRVLLVGHAVAGMPQHYATATVERLVELANRVKQTDDRTTLLRVVNG